MKDNINFFDYFCFGLSIIPDLLREFWFEVIPVLGLVGMVISCLILFFNLF